MDKDIIPAGDSSKLEVIFNTKGYINQIAKAPRILTNEDSSGSFSSVMIKAMITASSDSTTPVAIKPYKVDISQFSATPREEVDFTIENTDSQEVKLTLVDVPNDLMEVILPEVIEPGKTGQGTIRIRKDALDQQFDKSFTIEVNDQNHSRFTVPVVRSIRVQGKL